MMSEIRTLPSGLSSARILSRSEGGDGRKVFGYAALYDSYSLDLGGFVETIEPGAFDRALRSGGDVIGCIDHEETRLLGRTSSGTLRLRADARGLAYFVDTPKTDYGDNLLELLRRRDYRGSSFKFRVIRDRWEKRTISGELKRVRILQDVYLMDVCPVLSPAYPATSADVLAESSPRSKSSQMQANDNRLRLIQAELELAGVR